MIGASKCSLHDVIRIKALFAAGLNHTQISEFYTTESGHKISRTHISQILRGKKWNLDSHNFVMKDYINFSKELIDENIKLWAFIFSHQLVDDLQQYKNTHTF
jgi:hypothetical protein